MNDVDVAIVGCRADRLGARRASCALAGVSCAVYWSGAPTSRTSPARSRVHARTLELLDARGLADRARAPAASACPSVSARAGGVPRPVTILPDALPACC